MATGTDRLAEDIVFSQGKDLFVGCDYGPGKGWSLLLLPACFLQEHSIIPCVSAQVCNACVEGPMDNADGGTLLLFRLVHSMAFLRGVFLHSECPDSSLMATYHVLLWQGGWAGHGPVQQLCGKPWILVVRTMPGSAQMGKSLATDSCTLTFSREPQFTFSGGLCICTPAAPHEL